MTISFLGEKNHLDKKMLNWIKLCASVFGGRGRHPSTLRAQEQLTCRAAPLKYSPRRQRGSASIRVEIGNSGLLESSPGDSAGQPVLRPQF